MVTHKDIQARIFMLCWPYIPVYSRK